MATEIHTGDGDGGGGNTLIGFLLGAILIAVGVVAFFMWDNYKSHVGAPPAATVTIHKDK